MLLVTLSDGRLELEPVARFANGGHDVGGVFSWDVPYLVAEIERGLGEATRAAKARGLALSSVGVDSWAVDYGLLDTSGHLMRLPAHHRDPRTNASFAAVTAIMDPWSLYQRSGIAPLTFNTLFQLVADGDAFLMADRAELLGNRGHQRDPPQLGKNRHRPGDAGLCWRQQVLPSSIPSGIIR